MKHQPLLHLSIGLLLLAAISLPAQQHRAVRLGHPSTRFAPPLTQPEQLRALFADEKLKADVVQILRQEHSSVVLTAPGQAFDQGIVLDAWRHSGRLYWGAVKADKSPWIEVKMIAEGAAPPPAPRKQDH